MYREQYGEYENQHQGVKGKHSPWPVPYPVSHVFLHGPSCCQM